MTSRLVLAFVLSWAGVFCCRPASAQTELKPVMSTPPATQAEKEAIYNAAIRNRTLGILQALALTNAAKSNLVYHAIVAHYHALRARDEAIDDELASLPRYSAEWEVQRQAMLPGMSKPLHDQFLANLAKDLTPEQIETVKDQMTYGKVEFTYSAYCSILPKLTNEEKAKILGLLKQARDVAIDGGSAGEKTAIFQKYKDQINAYLDSRGYDVSKATAAWAARQKLASKTTGESAPNPAPSPK